MPISASALTVHQVAAWDSVEFGDSEPCGKVQSASMSARGVVGMPQKRAFSITMSRQDSRIAPTRAGFAPDVLSDS